MMLDSQRELASRLAIAGLVGLAAGLEREWSGHASGPHARFAGLRTFFLLGLLGGVAGALAAASQMELAAALLAGGGALCVCAYVMAARRAPEEADGTTEAAALTIVALGALAGFGWVGVAAGAGAIVVLLLSEKARLHWLVQRLGEPELRAGFQFAVLAVVVLPLLPDGPFLGPLAVYPRSLWMVVLLFSALNFVGFVAREIVGVSRGLGITGALGGVVSSTAVTLSFSRQSRLEDASSAGLARGVIAACTVMVPRVFVVSAVLNPNVALALLPLLAPPFLIGVVLVAVGWRPDDPPTASANSDKTPLRLGAAIRMAVAFQLAIVLVMVVERAWGSSGVFASAAVLGVTDIDALTVSMSRPEANLLASTAARAVAIGVLVNTLLKLTIALVLGRGTYRRRTITGLGGLALATASAILIL